jgi:hypothetical protein
LYAQKAASLSLRGRRVLLIKTGAFLRGNAANIDDLSSTDGTSNMHLPVFLREYAKE